MAETKHTQSSFLTSYIRGEAALGFWGLISKGLIGANALIIISALSVYHYGVYLLIFAFYQLVSAFLMRPLADVVFNDIVRFHAEGKDAEAKKLYFEDLVLRILLASVAFLAMFFGADLIETFYDKDTASFFRVISFLFFADVWSTAMRTIFHMRLRFGIYMVREVIFRLIKFIALVSLVFMVPFGIREALWAHVASIVVATAIFTPALVRAYSPWCAVSAARQSILWRIVRTYGKWNLASHAVASATNNIRPWLIKFFVNTEAVALYSVAASMFGAVKLLIPVQTLAVLIPREVSDRARRSDLFARGTKYILAISVILGVASALVAPPLLSLFLPHYIPSIPLFLILLAALPFVPLSGLGAQFLIALRQQKFFFYLQFVKITTGIIFPVVLLYFFGLWGMALERILVAIVIGGIYYWYLLGRHVDMFDWKTLITFTKEDRKLLRSVWGMVKENVRGVAIRYRPPFTR